MFIVWGTKRVETTLGYVADFCNLCRSVQAFRVVRVGMAGHVYGISAGQGKLAGHYRQCENCDCLLNARVEIYSFLEKHADKIDLATLTTRTFPRLAEYHAARFALEAQLRDSPNAIGPEMRTQLLLEPFQLLDPVIERRYGKTQLDFTMLGIIAAGLGLAWLVAGPMQMYYPEGDFIAPALFVILIATIAGLVVQSKRAGKRYLRNHIYPSLCTALRPLAPRDGELEGVIATMQRAGTQIGRRVNATDIQACLALMARGNFVNTPVGLAAID